MLNGQLHLASIGVLVGILGASAGAQIPGEKPPAFEVASVKISRSEPGQMVLPFQPGGRVTLPYRTLRQLIFFAYSSIFAAPLQDSQVVGGPDWQNADHFDIVAKMEGNPPPGRAFGELARLMLRTLLADRFKLVVHTEKRDLPAYALVLARPDGRLGPKLRRQDFDCDNAPVPTTTTIPDPNSPPAAPCGRLLGGPASFNYLGVGMDRVASGLSQPAGRIVIDRTGLKGRFDAELAWAPAGAEPTDAAPSVFTAVQEQLGLKLVPANAPIDVLVIDRAEKPTED